MNFAIFSTLSWDWVGGAHLPIQVSRGLARRGHRVIFVQPRTSSQMEGNPLIRIMSLHDLGLPEMEAERACFGLGVDSLEFVAERLSGVLRETEQPAELRVAIWFAPFEPFARLLPLVRSHGYHPIYYPQDDFSAMVELGIYPYNLPSENYLGSQASAIITASELVAQKMQRFGKSIRVIRDGIDLDDFRSYKRQSLLPESLRVDYTLGFWGWLSDTMVDPEPLAYLARMRPNWKIELIGGSPSETGQLSLVNKLQGIRNIHFHGEVPHTELASLGISFDACLLPAPDSDFSRGRDPIKVYEYLALHKPVICTHMPQLAGTPFVRNATTPQEFLMEIEAALQVPVDTQVIDAFLAKQTWAVRVDTLLELVRSLDDHEPASPTSHALDIPAGSLVAPNLVEETPGLKAYLAQMETDLAQTRRWARDLESAVIAKEGELQRIYHFLPVRVLRWLVHLFA